MNILVVGNKGFIGSWVEAHFAKEHQVWGCDVMVQYGVPRYFQIDPSNSDYMEIFSQQSFDVCINCSGAANVSDSMVHPRRDFLLNTSNVFYLLDAIRQLQSQCKFVQLSSAAVYGNPLSLPIRENETLRPISPYGWHKYQAELLCQEFHQVFGLHTCFLRIFSAYGPGLKKQLFWDLYQKCLQDRVVHMFGTGNETRDFIYIADVVQAMEVVVGNAAFQGEAINLASGIQTPIKEVVEMFIQLLGKQNQVEFNQKTKAGDPLYWEADIAHLSKLGYLSTYGLTQGIAEYVAWVQQLN